MKALAITRDRSVMRRETAMLHPQPLFLSGGNSCRDIFGVCGSTFLTIGEIMYL